jgi:EAL domain-containing protein (putative c-di-GMP-specific phosphodiesterase class I)/CheY-like chemotaxis protein
VALSKVQPLSILVIDDDPLSRSIIANTISGLGHTIDCIASIHDIELTRLFRYDVCILDLLMPDTDGIECLRLLNHSGAVTKIILISGLAERVIHHARNTAIAYDQQVIATFSKPVKPDELRRALALASVAESAPKGKGAKPQRLFTTEEIRSAMINHEFVVHLQPQIRLDTGTWYGVEALARWESPVHGLITPASFIEQVERSNLALPFTMMIIDASIIAAKHIAMHAGFEGNLSANMPPHVLNNVHLTDQILGLLQRHAFTPHRLMLEFTERSLPNNLSVSYDIQTRLCMRGVKLSIDDFGTGHSSMDRLRQTHFNEIKIDAAFVGAILDDKDTAHIVRNILDLSNNLNMTSVAEGIEDELTLNWLAENGCQVGQGFHICMPLPAERIVDWALKRQATLSGAWDGEHKTPERKQTF